MFPLHGPGHQINECKVMKAQAKAMNLNCSTSRDGGAGFVRLQGAKKRPTKYQELDALVASAVA